MGSPRLDTAAPGETCAVGLINPRSHPVLSIHQPAAWLSAIRHLSRLAARRFCASRHEPARFLQDASAAPLSPINAVGAARD